MNPDDKGAQLAKIKEMERKMKEEQLKFRMYEDIHSIKKWVKFFGIISVIALILAFLGLA